jgi:hypothetical protein
MKKLLALIGSLGAFIVAAGPAAAEDWRIFGAQGTVQVAEKAQEAVTIDNAKSPMMKVADGTTVLVKGKGKVVLVSLKSRQAFELGDNSAAVVEATTVRALKGVVNPRKGFSAPTGKDGKMGGVVMRGASGQSGCLKALSPIKTTILALTPELRWENRCRGVSSVNLTILADDKVVLAAEVHSASSYRVPEKILKEGGRYLWMIDGGASFDMASGVFAVADGKVREEVLQQEKETVAAGGPEERLTYVYFLIDRGFAEIAKEESDKLRAAFPEAAGLAELP